MFNCWLLFNLLAFADDVTIVTENKADMKNLTKVFLKDAAKVGLQVNGNKTDIMKISIQV